jgi:hypothetical protein
VTALAGSNRRARPGFDGIALTLGLRLGHCCCSKQCNSIEAGGGNGEDWLPSQYTSATTQHTVSIVADARGPRLIDPRRCFTDPQLTAALGRA